MITMRKCSVCRMTPISMCWQEDCPNKLDEDEPKEQRASCSLKPEGGTVKEEQEDTLLFNYV